MVRLYLIFILAFLLIVGRMKSQQAPQVGFLVESPVCIGTVPQFSVFVLYPGGTIIYWTMQGGTPATQTTGVPGLPVVTYSAAGIYTISAYGINNFGTSAIATRTIEILPLPQLNITPTQTICTNHQVTLSASGAVSYIWMPGNLTSSAIAVSPSINTVYTLTGSSFGCSATTTTSIDVKPVNFIPTSTTMCSGDTITLSSCLSLATYTWSNGSSISSVTLTPTSNSTYTCLAENSLSCAICTYSVLVSPVPTLSVNSPSLCEGLTGSICATGASTYSWLPLTGTVSGAGCLNITALSTIVYTVYGTSAVGCKTSATATLLVLEGPDLNSTNYIACANEPIEICVQGNATNYSWLPPQQNNPSDSCITVYGSSSTIFTVTGIGTNSCTNSATINLVVDACSWLSDHSQSELKLYPTHSKGSFSIIFPVGYYEISCYDNTSRLILRISSDKEEVNILTHEWAAGLYYLTITSEEKSFRRKILVE